MSDPKTTAATPDRYVSFLGLDCDGNAARLMDLIEQHAADPVHASPFWDYFLAKRNPKSGPKPDALFLIHTNINQLYELFHAAQDDQALALLEWIEYNCC